MAALGAACIATSAMLVRLADTTPATAAAYRCLLAVPLLAAVNAVQRRRQAPTRGRPRRQHWLAAGAGMFFAVDLVLWHHCIEDAGAGVATVLGNLQVVVVALVAWLLLAEQPPVRLLLALPVVLIGVVGVSGVLGPHPYGDHPLRGTLYGMGTSAAYAGYILLLRAASPGSQGTAGPLLTASAVAGVMSIALGAATDGVEIAPGWSSFGWLALLALTAQVLGWLLISHSLPTLPAAVTALILLLQPLGALVLGAVVLGERPSWVQLAGSALVLGGIVYGARRPAARAVPA